MGKFLVLMLGIAAIVCSFTIEIKVVQVALSFLVIIFGQKIRKNEGDSILISIGQIFCVLSIIEYIIYIIF